MALVSMDSNVLFSRISSSLHRGHQAKCHARVCDADLSAEAGSAPGLQHSFHTDVTKMLQELASSYNGSNDDTDSAASKHSGAPLISLAWICQALNVVIAIQESAKLALRTYATDRASRSDHKALQQHIKNGAKMVDACVLLKDSLARTCTHVKASHNAIKRLQSLNILNRGDFQRARHTLSTANSCPHKVESEQSIPSTLQYFPKRLQACSSNLRRIGEKFVTPSSEVHSKDSQETIAMDALYAVEICTVFFLRLLATALQAPRVVPSFRCMTAPGGPGWGPILLTLQSKFHAEVSQRAAKKAIHDVCCTTLLSEICSLDSSLHRIHQSLLHDLSIEQTRKEVQDLVSSASLLGDHLQSSLARLHNQLDRISAFRVDVQMVLL